MANYLYVKGNMLCYNARVGKKPTALYLADASPGMFNNKLVTYELLIQYNHLDTYPLHKKNVTDEDCLDESGIEKLKNQDYEIYIPDAKIIKIDSSDSHFSRSVMAHPDFEQIRLTIYEDWVAPKFIVGKDTDEETMKLLLEVEE